MALIVAVLGSFVGAIAGLSATVVFGASIVFSFTVYLTVTTGLLCTWALIVVVVNQPEVVAGPTYEDALDNDWIRTEAAVREKRIQEEEAFLEQLEAPLTDRERATGRDRDSA